MAALHNCAKAACAMSWAQRESGTIPSSSRFQSHAPSVDDDRTWGGHLVDFVLEEGEAELCLGTDFHMRLPLTEEFRTADLSEDMTEEIRRVEHH